MCIMNLHAKLKINWCLWSGIALPWIFILLFRQTHDKAGNVWSDWSWILYNAGHEQWSYCREVLMWDLLPPLVLGWVAQYLFTLAWEKLRGTPKVQIARS
jgi:hypothetical protein